MRDEIERRNIYDGFFMIAAVLCFLLFSASAAYGHKVYLFAWADGETVYTESYFSGNKKVRDSVIKVFDNEGNELLNGRTNEKGEFSFKTPKVIDLRIVLESSMGHGAEYLFKKTEFSSGETIPAEEAADTSEEVEAQHQLATEQDQLRIEIEAALDVRLKPVIRELAKLREDKKPGVTEIIGGIGYIIGIMGIVAYMKSRKK